MTIAVYGRKLKPETAKYVQEIFDLLEAHQLDYTVYAPFYRHLVRQLKIKAKENTFDEKEDIVGKN